MMNYDSYEHLSDQEIENLSEHLAKIKIIRKREFQEIIINKDFHALEEYLSKNNHNLKAELIDITVFDTIIPTDIDFLRLIIKSPQWENQFKQKSLDVMFENIFKYPELIDFFAVEDKNILIDYAIKGQHFDNLSIAGAETLFKLKIFDFKDENVKKYFKKSAHEFLIVKAIEKNKLKLTTREIELMFEQNVLNYSDKTLEIIANHTATCVPINIAKVILSFGQKIMGYHGYNENERYIQATKLFIEHDNYEYIIIHAQLNVPQLKSFLALFDNNFNKYSKEGQFFVNTILQTHPKFKIDLNSYMFKNTDLLYVVNKALLYDKLENNIENKDSVTKKLKI